MSLGVLEVDRADDRARYLELAGPPVRLGGGGRGVEVRRLGKGMLDGHVHRAGDVRHRRARGRRVDHGLGDFEVLPAAVGRDALQLGHVGRRRRNRHDVDRHPAAADVQEGGRGRGGIGRAGSRVALAATDDQHDNRVAALRVGANQPRRFGFGVVQHERDRRVDDELGVVPRRDQREPQRPTPRLSVASTEAFAPAASGLTSGFCTATIDPFDR